MQSYWKGMILGAENDWVRGKLVIQVLVLGIIGECFVLFFKAGKYPGACWVILNAEKEAVGQIFGAAGTHDFAPFYWSNDLEV